MAVVWSSLTDADGTFVDEEDDTFLRRTIDVPIGKLSLSAEAELFLVGCCCSACDTRPVAVSSLNVSMMETVLRAGLIPPPLAVAELTADDDEDADP